MKKLSIVFAIVLSGLIAAGAVACTGGDDPQTPFTVSPQTLSFDAAGGSERVTVGGGDWTATPQQEWISVDPASGVAGGYFTVTVGPGTTENTGSITVKNSSTGETLTIAVTQSPPDGVAVTGVTLDATELTLTVGDVATLQATVLPADATNRNVVWESSAPAIATVVDGVVTAIAAGETTVTVTTEEGGRTATCTVKVEEPREPDVYVAGYTTVSTVRKATYWKNGEPQILSDNESTANSIFVSGDDVYVAGHVTDSENIMCATLWKNGTALTLENVYASSANSVFVAGGDVYVAGYYMDMSYKYFGILWKNENSHLVVESAYTSSVFVSGSDVYVGGNTTDASWNSFATIWKNDQAQTLEGQQVNSVYVAGGDVYAAGSDNYSKAAFWKNGAITTLNTGSTRASSIFVSGSDVYVAGYLADENYNNDATLWKNGELQIYPKTQREAEALSVCVNRDNVYVAGYQRDSDWTSFAALWVNGELQSLSTGASMANAVFVR